MNFLTPNNSDSRFISHAARVARDWYNNESCTSTWGTEVSELLRGIHITDSLQNFESRTYFDFQAHCQLQVERRDSPLDFTFNPEPNLFADRPVRELRFLATFPDGDLPAVREIVTVVPQQTKVFTEEDIEARETSWSSRTPTYVRFTNGTAFVYDPGYRTQCGVAGAVILSTDRRYAGGFLDLRNTSSGDGLIFERAVVRPSRGSNTRETFVFNWYYLPGPGYFGIGTQAA